LVFAVKEEEKEDLITTIKSKLKEKTLSENTAFVVYEKLEIPPAVQKYALEAKKSMKYLYEAKQIVEENNIRVEYVTGECGLIGALAAIGLYNMPEEYAKVYYEE
jgi:tRNA(Ile2) C34 agmatinyltransferase TiaS